jgi:NAD(P)-dependent dehydrogenase (short-subunit alcohol dehydrogenase family)
MGAMNKKLLVIGASGDVGQGIIAAAASRGWQIVASGRTQAKLDGIAAQHQGVTALHGDVGTPESAAKLMDAAKAAMSGLHAVVVSVSAPVTFQPLLDQNEESIVSLFRHNIVSHLHAAKAALDALPEDGILLGLGGGLADFVPPGGAHQSMIQAGLRNIYRGLARESKARIIRQMQIVSMVNGMSKRDRAEESWLTDRECGEHVCAILDQPDKFKGPIIALKSREGVGQSEV